jgi:hypothetical protein
MATTAIERQKNLSFLKDSVTEAGFGSQYHKVIEEGYKPGKGEIELKPFIVPLAENAGIVYQPRVTEGNDLGRYNFNGYLATLYVEGKAPREQFFGSYMMAGMNIDQAKVALTGGTVLHTDWNKKAKTRKQVFARLDLSLPVEPGENHRVIRVDAKDIDLSRLLSKEDIYINQTDKEKLIANIQTGETFDVRVRETIDGKEKLTAVSLRLHLADEKTMTLVVSNSEGKVLRVAEVNAKEASQIKSIGVVLSDATAGVLPEGLLKLMNDHKAEQTAAKGLRA